MDETAPFRPGLLRTSGLTKGFGALVALDRLDLTVPRHSIVSLIGPNGSGKTVAFNLLSGTLKPDGGTILFNGASIGGLAPDQVALRGIARTFQEIRLFANMTVLDNVLVGEHGRLRAGIWDILRRSPTQTDEEQAARAQAADLLAFVDLPDAAGRVAKNLSYGDQRRLEVARALAGDPLLLLLDEPTAGMNPQETAALMRLIRRVRDERGVTVLLIEHDMKLVMRISDGVVVLSSGVKIAEGRPDEVRSNPRVIEAYLGRAAALAPTANGGESSTAN